MQFCQNQVIIIIIGALIGAGMQCKQRESDQAVKEARIILPKLGISLPQKSNWTVHEMDNDPNLHFRLKHNMQTIGAPRIDFIMEAIHADTTTLSVFKQRSLKSLKDMQQAGQIKIRYEDVRRDKIGPYAGYRLRHDYLLRLSDKQHVPISQMSLLYIYADHEITITAVGRTEFFQAVLQDIMEITDDIKAVGVKKRRSFKQLLGKKTDSNRPDAISAASYSPFPTEKLNTMPPP